MIRYIKIFNSVVNSIGSLFIWVYVLWALWIGLKFLEIKLIN